MKKTKQLTSSPLTSQRAKPSDAATAKQLMEQYRVAVAADVEAARQKLKFGAMLALWANYLGCGAGRGHEGEGLKGWLAENCPEIAYTAAMNYKYKAEKAAEMLGGGMRAMAALLSLCNDEQGDALRIEAPGDVIELTEKERDAAIKLCENVESLGRLEQMYFDFMRKRGRDGARPSPPLPKPTRAEAAARVWAGIMVQLGKAAAYDTIALLRPKYAAACYERLQQLTAAMKAQMKVEA